MTIRSLDDLARRLRLSRRTVSRVLTRHKNVAPAVRERVEKYLTRTGYVPNAQASRLAGGRVPVVGLVFPTGFLSTLDDYVARIIKGALTAIRPAGHQLTLIDFEFLNEAETARLHRGRLVGGMVFVAFGARDFDAFRRLRAQDIPLSLVHVICPGVDSFECDNRRGGYAATRHLLDAGHRRIAFLHGTPEWTSAQERYDGYVQALTEAGRKVVPGLIANAFFDSAQAKTAAARLLAHPAPPDALFAANDRMMIGAYEAARERGLRVPEDLALVGFDDMPLCGSNLLEVTFSSVAQPLEAIAQAAVERVMALMNGRRGTPPEHRLFTPELKIRESSGGVNPSRWA